MMFGRAIPGETDMARNTEKESLKRVAYWILGETFVVLVVMVLWLSNYRWRSANWAAIAAVAGAVQAIGVLLALGFAAWQVSAIRREGDQRRADDDRRRRHEVLDRVGVRLLEISDGFEGIISLWRDQTIFVAPVPYYVMWTRQKHVIADFEVQVGALGIEGGLLRGKATEMNDVLRSISTDGSRINPDKAKVKEVQTTIAELLNKTRDEVGRLQTANSPTGVPPTLGLRLPS